LCSLALKKKRVLSAIPVRGSCYGTDGVAVVRDSVVVPAKIKRMTDKDMDI